MKRKIIIYISCILVIFIVAISTIFNFNKEKELVKISVGEVAHSIFYAPFYVAYENKYFEDKGIDADIILLNGADKVASALLSNDVEIGLSGAEATIYVYNGGEKDYLQTFSQLTQKDGSFIVSRKKIKNFTLDDLKGTTVIGGRAAGMPEMTLEYVLKKHNIDPRSDLDIDTSIAFPAMGGTFIGGYGDFVTLFEPTASMVEKEGYGYVVASVGELGGVVPYTSFSARKSYIKEHTNIIKNFDEAIQMGIDYVYSHTDEEVAKVILPQFPDSSLEEVKASVKRYREIEAWPTNTKFTKKSFDHLQDIMIDYGELDKKVSYEKLFYK
ncbi:MAG: ABC transporter substrate-binding protein [Bacilli bacterium]|nr:ABC transporter substrate-binding protein [Bacilli bacterium]